MEVEMNFVFQIELEQILGLNQDLAPSSYIAQTDSGNNKNKVSTQITSFFFSLIKVFQVFTVIWYVLTEFIIYTL